MRKRRVRAIECLIAVLFWKVWSPSIYAVSVLGLFALLRSCRQRKRKNERQLKSVPPAMQAVNNNTLPQVKESKL